MSTLHSTLGWVGSGVTGLWTGTFMAQVLNGNTPTAPPGWESLGLGGFAISLAMWMVRESYTRRIEEAKEYAANLERIYAAEAELQRTTIAHLQTAADRNFEMLRVHLGSGKVVTP